MKIKIVSLTLSVLTLIQAKPFQFNVVSIFSPSYTLGVKYNGIVKPLTPTTFPLFTGIIEEEEISQYKYVALNQSGEIHEEETIERTYSEESSNTQEVFNRTNKQVEIPEFPELFTPMFPMGTNKFQPFPHNEIYNVYADCDDQAYTEITTYPFKEGTNTINKSSVNCTINIVTPHTTFTSPGSIHIVGYGSRKYKKLSWSLKLDKKFMGRKSVKLRAMASDPTLMREKFITELFKSVGVPVQEGNYARLIINHDVYGLYSFTDGLASRWISAYVHGEDKYSIGTAYKLFSSPPTVVSDLKYKGDDYTLYYDQNAYQLDEFDDKVYDKNDLPSLWQPLIEFTKKYKEWVDQYDTDTSDKAIDALKEFLNIESLLRLLAIESLTLLLDNFWLRMSNAALYYNPERNNYQFLPYDFDQGIIGTKGAEALSPDFMQDCGTWANYNEDLLEHYFTNHLMSHPQIKKRYNVILAKTSRDLFKETIVSEYLNQMADLIREEVTWNFQAIDRLAIGYDGYMNHFTMEDFESNIEYGHVAFDKTINVDDAPYGIEEWVEVRGASCRDYTAQVDLSHNENISDNVEVAVYHSSESGNNSSHSGATSSFSSSLPLSLFLVLFSLFYYTH